MKTSLRALSDSELETLLRYPTSATKDRGVVAEKARRLRAEQPTSWQGRGPRAALPVRVSPFPVIPGLGLVAAILSLLPGCGSDATQDALNNTANDWAVTQHEVPKVPTKAPQASSTCQAPAPEEAQPDGTVPEVRAQPGVPVAKASATDPMVTVIYKFEAGGVDERWPSDFQENRVRTTVERFPESVWLASANAIPCVKSFAGQGQYMCDFTRQANAGRAPNCDARSGTNRWNGEIGCAPVRLSAQGERVVVTVEKFVYQDPRLESPVVAR